MTSRVPLVLAFLVSACANARPQRAVIVDLPIRASVSVAEAGPECDGLVLELLVRDHAAGPGGGSSRRTELRCHTRGATLTQERAPAPGSDEGGSVTIELDPAQAAALWAELRSVALVALACGAAGALQRRIEITGTPRARVVECTAAETPPAWSALEATLTSAPRWISGLAHARRGSASHARARPRSRDALAGLR